MDRVRKLTGAQEWNWQEGEPVTIAVLDSGMAAHADLEGKGIAFRDFVNGNGQFYDDNGHGTHICGILAGSGRLSGGRFRGMAPQSRLVVGKVLDRRGEGSTEQLLAGLQWIRRIKETFRIRLLNISIGIGDLQNEKKEELIREEIERLLDNGIAVFCAAGNKGPENNSLSSVGRSMRVITVGCHDGGIYENGRGCERYSGRGDYKSPVRKPDLIAPGTDVISCNAHWTPRSYKLPYLPKSGTSMSTAVVCGAAALLLQRDSGLSTEGLRNRLLFDARDLGEPWNLQGWGMVALKADGDQKFDLRTLAL